MFSKKSQTKKGNSTPNAQIVNIIGEDSIVEGRLVSNGSIRIDGTVKGNIEVEGKLLLSPTAKVIGDIVCTDAEICGTVDGIIQAQGLVSMKESAKIKGDIFYSQIEITPGAQLDSKLVQTKGRSESITDNTEVVKMKKEIKSA